MLQVTATFQVLSLVGSAAIVVVFVAIVRRWPEARIVAVVPGLWAAGGVIYYTLLLSGRFTSDALLLWGAVHRFAAVALVLGMVVTLYGLLRAEEMDLAEPPDESDGGD